MLLSLISVLVLLVIAFYALWMGVTGRLQGTEGPELSIGGRLLVLGIALIGFGAAYAVYSHPGARSSLVAAPRADATPAASAQPAAEASDAAELEARRIANRNSSPVSADEAAEPVAAIATAEGADEAADTASAAMVEPDVEAETVAATSDAEPVKAITMPKVAAMAAGTSPAPAEREEVKTTSGLSAGAAELEAAEQQRRTAPAVRAPATPTSVVAASAMADRPTAETVEPKSAAAPTAAPRRTAARRNTRRAAGPLTLQVYNDLGGDQQYEQLTLRIEGKTVAVIEVDQSQPSVLVEVPLPRPGLLHYQLDGLSAGNGSTRLMGHGCITVREGARFAVKRRDGNQRVYLQAMRDAG